MFSGAVVGGVDRCRAEATAAATTNEVRNFDRFLYLKGSCLTNTIHLCVARMPRTNTRKLSRQTVMESNSNFLRALLLLLLFISYGQLHIAGDATGYGATPQVCVGPFIKIRIEIIICADAAADARSTSDAHEADAARIPVRCRDDHDDDDANPSLLFFSLRLSCCLFICLLSVAVIRTSLLGDSRFVCSFGLSNEISVHSSLFSGGR